MVLAIGTLEMAMRHSIVDAEWGIGHTSQGFRVVCVAGTVWASYLQRLFEAMRLKEAKPTFYPVSIITKYFLYYSWKNK